MNLYKYEEQINNNTIFLPKHLKFNKKGQNRNIIHIKKIKFENSNKLVIKKLLRNRIILALQKIKKINSNKQAKFLLKDMQKSGYFSHIKILQFSDIKELPKFYLINVKTNPILKKVDVLKYKKLYIPRSFLKKIFESQIGLPKNYNQIYKSIKKIQFWYKSRGFEFINIKLINQNTLNNISLSIDEGIIKKIEIINKSNKLSNKKFHNDLSNLITEQLNMQTHCPVNVKELELSLIRLKNMHILKDCYYLIDYKKKDIHIKIYYQILETSPLYLYCKNELIDYKKLYKSFYKNIRILNIIKTRNIFNIWYLCSYIINIQQNIIFNYNLSKENTHINYFIIETNFKNQLQKLSACLLKYLFLENNNMKILGTLTIKIYDKLSKYILFYPNININLSKLYYIQITNLIIQLKEISIFFKHTWIQNLNISEYLFVVRSLYSKIYLYIQDFNCINNLILNKNFQRIGQTIKKRHEAIENILIYLNLTIKYNSLYLIEYIPIGKSLEVKYTFLNLITPSIRSYFHKLQYFNQIITSTYIHHLYLPRLIPYIYKNILTFFIKTNLVVNKSKHNLYQKYFFDYNDILNESIFSGFSLHIEYHIYKFKYLSVYLLHNSMNHYFNKIKYKHIKFTSNNCYITHKGFGIQLNIPIKQLSNIKIEYTVNSIYNYCINIKYYSKYN